ncbi:MAG: ABC transporter ATP-binding protein [Myxococcota bacterium]|nr:ABC transporter ATP-binding protein [Myxococcota bacterium]
MSQLAVDIQGLRFAYEGGFSLSLSSFQVAPGERVALHGPSGCGKSTLLNLIAGSLVADSGTLKVHGTELSGLSEAQRRAWRVQNVGFVFQDYPLVDYLSAVDNVLLPYRLNTALKLDSQAQNRALELLGTLDLAAKTARKPHQLSQGERQRVAIARALVTQPQLLLADEPTTGLDPQRSEAVLGLLESLVERHKLTLLLVTHDPQLRARLPRALDLGA